MDDNKKVVVANGLSINTIGLVVWIVFMCLKYSGTWDIPLFWVWFPFWIGPAIDAAIIVLSLIFLDLCAFVAWLIESHEDQRRRK